MSAKQSRQWVAVANSVLERCIADGGDDTSCAPKAITQANGVVGEPALAKHKMLGITLAIHADAGTIRYEQLDGRDYLVAPVVPIVAGVLNQFLVPEEEIAAFVHAWDGLAVPLGHPTNDYGDYISVNSPELLEKSLGRFFHARMDGHKLLGELWLDIAKCEMSGGDAIECLRRLEAGENLEVSTAFYSEAIMDHGIYNGVQYTGIHRHLRPDHLALLPNDIGACSWADGCGAPRAHATTCSCQGDSSIPPTSHARSTARRPTFDGTETTAWSAPTLATYVSALMSDMSMAERPGSVSVLTAAQKRMIARHTLLGDETAETFSELSFFPVVNPRTGKVNERALRAVLGGRGSQADIAEAAKTSAQTMARRLLNSEFDAGLSLEGNMHTGERQGLLRAVQTLLGFASHDNAAPALTTNLTHDDLRMALGDALMHRHKEQMEGGMSYGCPFLMDIEEGFVIYRMGYGNEACTYRHAYTVDEATKAVTLTGEPEEVQRNTTYLPMATMTGPSPGGITSQQSHGGAMKPKAELVQTLIAHQQTAWKDTDKATLEAFNDEQLTRLVVEADARTAISVATQTTTVQTTTAATPHVNAQEVAVHPAQVAAIPVTLEALTTLLKTEFDARDKALEGKLAMLSQQASEQAERTQLVAHLGPQGFTEQMCTGMSLDALRQVARTVLPATFAGIGFPAFPSNDDDDLPSDAPTWQ